MCVSVFVHVWRLNLCPTVSITVQQTAELCKVAMISIYGYLLLLLLWVTSRVVAAVAVESAHYRAVFDYQDNQLLLSCTAHCQSSTNRISCCCVTF